MQIAPPQLRNPLTKHIKSRIYVDRDTGRSRAYALKTSYLTAAALTVSAPEFVQQLFSCRAQQSADTPEIAPAHYAIAAEAALDANWKKKNWRKTRSITRS